MPLCTRGHFVVHFTSGVSPQQAGAGCFLLSSQQNCLCRRLALHSVSPGLGSSLDEARGSGVMSRVRAAPLPLPTPPRAGIGNTVLLTLCPEPSEWGLLPGHLLSPPPRPPYGRPEAWRRGLWRSGWPPTNAQIKGSLGANPGCGLSKVLTCAIKWEPSSQASERINRDNSG